ncbi:MAG: ribonuclease E/G, partial [Colwellia sp.]
MSSELLINVTPSETRVALIEQGSLQEVHIEREAKRGIVGNIYLGKVIRVLPGMQAAFVDINLDKAAFLHASDINTKLILKEGVDAVPDIRSLVHEGQYIMVQVVKDPLGSKGARLTTDITIASRYLVLMPHVSYAGISQRIEGEKERKRLKEIISPYCDEEQGFIVRTAGEGAGEQALKHDAEFLRRVWSKVQERKQRKQVNMPLYQDLSLSLRVLRDFVGMDFERIRIDSKLTFEQL